MVRVVLISHIYNININTISVFTFHSMRCGDTVGECGNPRGKASPNREVLVWWSSRLQGALFKLLGLAGPLLPVPVPLSLPSVLALTRSRGSTKPSEGRIMQLW